MTQYIEAQMPDADDRGAGSQGTRLAFENAYRLKKKALISDIERSLGIGLHHGAPTLPVT